MKTIVFIFVPLVIEQTEIRVVAESAKTEKQVVPRRHAGGKSNCLFWSWFVDNPRPQFSK